LMRGYIAVVTAVVAAVLAPSALAANDHRTLGPAGYDTPGQSTLVLAGAGGIELGSGDHAVICHAIGGAKGTEFIQIAPSASGVLNGHDGHEGDRDVIPPYTYVDNKGQKDASLAAGSNWSGANLALYSRGCGEERPPNNPPEQPRDECPNIAGNQQSVPAGLVKDASGNCVQPPSTPTDVCPNIEGVQSSVPAGLIKDASGNCAAPTVTVTVTTVPQTVPQTVPVVASTPAAPVAQTQPTVQTSPKAKKKVKKKAKRVKTKKAKKVKAKKKAKAKKGRLPGVLPYTR
jgi:hypothetical protein